MANKLLNVEQLEKINSNLDQLLSNYQDTSDQWKLILDILNREKIELREGDLKDISGMLLQEQPGHWVIVINKDDSKARKLFTIAHELGHYKLHRDQSSQFVDGQLVGQEVWNRDENDKYAQFEIEANEFAAGLIMPEKSIKIELKELSKDQITQAVIKDLADKFGVSSLAMLIRLKNLGYAA